MDPRLERIVEGIKIRRNPGGPALDAGKLLQTELVAEDFTFSEDDLFRALDALGIPEDEQLSWFEDFASYI